MSKSPRRNHIQIFKAKALLSAIRGVGFSASCQVQATLGRHSL